MGAPGVIMRPVFCSREMESIALFRSLASRMADDDTFTPIESAEVSIARRRLAFATFPALIITSTWLMPGAISLSSSSHFPLTEGGGVHESSRVAAGVGQARHHPGRDWIAQRHEDDRDCARL